MMKPSSGSTGTSQSHSAAVPASGCAASGRFLEQHQPFEQVDVLEIHRLAVPEDAR